MKRLTPPLPGETPAEWSARVRAAHPDWGAPPVRARPHRAAPMFADPPAKKPAKPKPRPHCVYCGAPHAGRAPVCPSCADLPEYDAEGVDWWVMRLGWDEAVELARVFSGSDVDEVAA